MTTARIIFVTFFLAMLVGLSQCAAGATMAADRKYGAVVGLYVDAGHSDCDVIGPAFLPFEMWVWWLPATEGLMAAEFAIQYPSNVIASTVTQNPAITVFVGNLPSGISVAFGDCQTGWTWTHHQQCYLFNSNNPVSTNMQIIPHPTAGLQIADCTCGYPLWPAATLTSLCLNQSCMCQSLPQLLPKLIGVTVTGLTSIRALFDMCVEEGYIVPQHFVLRNKANPTDSIKVAQATWIDDDAYDLVLQKAMVDSTAYVLIAREAYWSCSYEFSNHTEFEFTFHEATATKEASWGAIKALFGK